MPITPLPSLDRTSATFRTDVDLFFASQLPAFGTEFNALQVDVTAKQSLATTAADTATTKAGEASASANSAVSARDAAQSARDAALVALDSFDDRYLGAKAAAPVVDNDGAALLTGAIYFDTVIGGGSWRAWNGSAWVTAPAANASAVTNTPSGSISATNVQAAINELATEKAASGPLATSGITGAAASGANTDITSLGSLASLNGGQLAGMRNLLINGNLAINQRGYVSGTATSGANQYTLDRWRVVTSGQNLTFTASGNGNSMTAPAGGVEQVIEGANIGGGTYVLGWTGTATATVNGTARTKGATFTLPANTNATVRLIGGTASLVQLEPGGTVTPFEHRPIGAELAMCQRYYLRTGEIRTVSTASGRVVIPPSPVPLRATPSVTIGDIRRIDDDVLVISAPSLGGITENGSAWTLGTTAGSSLGVKITGGIIYSTEL